jgi:hypothetical protein
MSDFNACFVSYRHPNDANAKKFVQTFVDVLTTQLQPNLPNAKIFFDKDGLQVGDIFSDKLAQQLCRSACLVIFYGPRHFDVEYPYCALEYLGMRELEERRRAQMRDYLDQHGLIFPVVFRGFDSLPREIKDNRLCINFDDVTKWDQFKHGQRRDTIDQLARRIYERWTEMERRGIFANHDCSQFRFPGNVQHWLEQNIIRTRTPMPSRQ